MFNIEKWHEIYQALAQNKARTALTAFGVFWGIFMLVIMLGAGKGLENGVYDGMGEFKLNSAFMWTMPTTKEYKGFPKGRYYNFDNGDVEAIRKYVKGIEFFAPRLSKGSAGDNVVRGLKAGNYELFGDYPEWNYIDPMTITAGRNINYNDINSYRKVAVIGNRIKQELFKKDEDPIGQMLRVNGVYFQVVGVVKSKKNGRQAEREESNLFMPFTTMQKTYNMGDRVGWFSLTSKEGYQMAKIEKEVMDIIKKRHSIAPDDDRAIGHANVEEEANKINGLFLGISGLTWLVGAGTLLAGVIGVSNIMLVIIRERTKEIGIQRALGATPWEIRKQIIMESVVLTTFAGYIGLVLGVGLLELVSSVLLEGADTGMFNSPEIDFNIAVASLILLIISGAFAGLIPAQRAISIKPIDALRDE